MVVFLILVIVIVVLITFLVAVVRVSGGKSSTGADSQRGGDSGSFDSVGGSGNGDTRKGGVWDGFLHDQGSSTIPHESGHGLGSGGGAAEGGSDSGGGDSGGGSSGD